MNKTNWEAIEKRKCFLCHKPYSHTLKEKLSKYKKRRFCSNECKMLYLSKLNSGKKAHNNKQVEKECIVCHIKKMVSPAFKNRPFCGRACMAVWYSEKQRGKAHWNWQGGITETPSRDSIYPGYNEWRTHVYRRDGFKCVLCGKKKSGELQAHHIKPRSTHKELILDISNGLTVCKKCHSEIHYGKGI